MLLFLHGFLGQKEDWDPLFSHLDLPLEKIAIDLPCHGSAPVAEDIALAVKNKHPKAKFLIGYSAGGRIALELKNRFPSDYEKVILISAHPGLIGEEEKKKRWEIDKEWIELLTAAPFEEFLRKWYDQNLFSNLKRSPLFFSLFEKRRKQNPHKLAHFLHTYSISKKDSSEMPADTVCICGKEDLKYEKLYRTLSGIYKIYTIENANHAVHLENPKALAKKLQEIIGEHE